MAMKYDDCNIIFFGIVSDSMTESLKPFRF